MKFCLYFLHFSSDLDKIWCRRMHTTIYWFTMRSAKIGAVEVVLCLRSSTNIYPYCPQLWAGELSRYSFWDTGWTIRDRIPVGTIFSARPDRSWGPPSLLYNGYQLFPGVNCDRGVLLTTHPLPVPRSWKSRAIPLPTLWATPGL